MVQFRLSVAVGIAMGVAMLTACSGGGGGQSSVSNPALPPMSAQRSADNAAVNLVPNTSVLNSLTHQRTIGSTIDPVTHQGNPYGLDIAKVSSGKLSAGDLVVCNFNNAAGTQGQGTSIIALHPVVGAATRHIINTEELKGCTALAMSPVGPIWAVAFTDLDAPIISGSGTLLTSLDSPLWNHPFGETFVPPPDARFFPSFIVSNAGNGNLIRIGITPAGFTFTTIVTGFPVNHGVPGSILGPSGLNYVRAFNDRLYVVDGTNNALYAIDHISNIHANGIAVHGFTFSGPQAFDAHVIYHGAPLNGPISSAILFNGNVAVGNTLDPNGKNLIVEISPTGSLLAVKNVDTGAAGAIFGMVASGTTLATQKLYYNNDNDNTTRVLSP
jgi:hypothetical protein